MASSANSSGSPLALVESPQTRAKEISLASEDEIGIRLSGVLTVR